MTAEDASNTLLYAPLGSSIDDAACVRLTETVPLADATFVCITFTQTADDRLSVYRSHDCDRPRRTGVISVGVGERSGSDSGESVQVMSVSNPNDLSRVGLTLSKYLREAGEGPTAVCVHSVTGLLQFVGRDRAYRFLLTLKGELEAAGAVAHYHMDPDAHSAETEYTLRPAFDTVVDANELLDGGAPEVPFSAPPTPDSATADSTDASAPPDTPADADRAAPTPDAGETAGPADTVNPPDSVPATEDTGGPADGDAAGSEFIWGPHRTAAAGEATAVADDTEFIWGPHPGGREREAAPEDTGDGSAAEEPAAGTPVEWVESPAGDRESRWLVDPVVAGIDRVARAAAGAALILGGAAAATLDVPVASPALLRLTGVLAAVVGAILLSEGREN